MPIDFRRIVAPRPTPQPTDPIVLFQSLRVTDLAINDLWLAQGDTLREWDKHRQKTDIAIALNTGAGKTLVGLLAAQSLVHETNGRVLYACSSIQLVFQTESKARGYGLNATTYTQGALSNMLYSQGLAPCITTYHALFNGLSRFAKEDIAAVVFDDAHTAGHILRDQFTLHITRDTFPGTFTQLTQIFRSYFTRIGRETGYTEAIDSTDMTTSWFVPPFAVRQQLTETQRVLRDARLGDSVSTKFAWEYIKDHLDLCAVFVSRSDVSFTPSVVPVRTLSYFGPGVRRIYLSATLRAEDGFLRAFGKVPDHIIAPSTTAGECERLILIPTLCQSTDARKDDVTAAKQITAGHKCLVLVPNRLRSGKWDDVATKFDDSVAEQVEEFKATESPTCLVLTARYDGVDLPGDTCRVLVIDDLPTGLNPLEHYLWDRLGLGKLLRSTVASRVVQSFGRISRGMSDHGVVVLSGPRLTDWLLSPKNRSLLPDFLQRQLQLGIDLSRQVVSVKDMADAVKQCLLRDQTWIEYYRDNIDQCEASHGPAEDAEDVLRMTQAEVDFGHAFWARDFPAAGKALERDLEKTFDVSRPTGAWHALWLGYTYELMGDMTRAYGLYARAHRAEGGIPALDVRDTVPEEVGHSPQVLAVASLLGGSTQSHLEPPKNFDTDLAALDGTATVPQVEAALVMLGEYLGLESQRPDNEFNTGPDVLWMLPGGPAVSIEAKTAKGGTTVYTKRDLGQLRDHRRWVCERLGDVDVHSVFVGPVVPSSPDANPDPDMVVIELAEFHALRDRLRAALLDICAAAVPITAPAAIQATFDQRGLSWPEVYEGLSKQRLCDIVVP